jgi:ABC-type transport system substrate-binding protein
LTPALKQQLEATGAIQVELNAQDLDTVQKSFGNSTFMAGTQGWYPDFADPSETLDAFIYVNDGATNITRIQSGPVSDKASQLIALAKQADVESDLAKRSNLYKQIQDLYADLVVTLPLYLENVYIVYRDGIRGSGQYAAPEALNIGSLVQLNYSTLVK